MFRTKKDVERHVADVLSKIDNENEKHLRGYTFARLFFQVKDYESAKKYLTGFLSVRDHHAASHKLMAQINEATNNPENALQSYKRSLEIDPHQNDIVLKICELYCQLPVDHETAKYWADRAEQLYPHHDTVFKLREYLVSAEGEPDRHELENLIASDLAAQPKNVDRRIKLLRLYLDTERVKEAYDHATMIESKQMFPYSVDWYYLLSDIFEAYQEEYVEELDSQFYINYLTALDHLVYLTLAEPHTFVLENGKKPSSLNDAAAVLLSFDQLLKKAVQQNIKEGSWNYFINHMKGQLYFHMTSLLMKRAKMDQGNRKESFRFSAGLACVCYTFKPINILHEVWFLQMKDNQKTFTNFFQQGSLRTSFIGHVLLSLCKDDKSSWLQKMKTEVCINQVKERIYNRVFTSLFKKEKLPSSYFISDSTFEQSSLELPSEVALKEYDKSAYKLCPHSLHHLVWLELHIEKARISSPDIISEIFKNLQYCNKNLSKGSCESLCVLDLESYLYACVYQSKFLTERKNSILNIKNDSILSYPPDITDALCTTVQATWWKAAYGLYTCSIKEKLGEYRRNLQQGLEVIRGIGSHGMELQLVIYLAHIFSSKAEALEKVSENKTDKNKNKLTSEKVTALYSRATHYWNVALGMLDKLLSGKTLNVPKNPMFVHSNKSLSKNDMKSYIEEGQLFLAVRLMDSDKLNEAAALLSNVTSPYGSYYLALTLKKLASQEQKFSSTRTALLNKAKSSLHETLDRIKDDKTHPLNKEIFIELEDVENDIAFEHSISNENNCEDPDETDSYDESLHNSSSLYDPDISATHSTPRPSSKFLSSRRITKPVSQLSSTKHVEPSPERLDAQIRALALNQDVLTKSFLEQQQALLETNKSIVEALKQNKDVVEQLKKQLEELSLATQKFNQKTTAKKSVFKSRMGLGDEEEEYYDPNSILDYYEDGGDEFRAAGYSFDRPSRIAHDPASGASAPINYVVPQTLPPPGPPPTLHHYNYQYPPHAVLPTPPAPVPERPPYYHPPPGQGLPFNEGQQLPQFHFHVASAVGKPPQPPSLSTTLPQVVSGLPPPSASVPPLSVPQGLPPPSVSVPPMSVAMPPPPVAPPLSAANPWSKPVSVPHAFQIHLPPSVFVSSSSSIPPTLTQVTSSAQPAVSTTSSQLKDLLQSPPVSRTITFGQPANASQSAAATTPPSIFSGLNKTPDTSKERTRYDSETATSPDIDGHDLEKEVMGDFKPLIPLPAEIVVETGEENEVVLFEDRAKLYRYIDQEWKERGIGVVKILHHEGSGRVRLLMRRDQVLKVCANHYINSSMEIRPLKNSDKAWTWVAQDFADEELRPEHFCIRFKTPEVATAFKTAFDKAISISKESVTKNSPSPKVTASVTSPLSSKSFGSKFSPKPGSWTCPTCYGSNAGDKLLCSACETKKPGSLIPTAAPLNSANTTTSVTSDFGAKYLPKPGSWTCSTCYVNNSGDKLSCVACETKKPGSVTSTSISLNSAVTSTSVTSGFGAEFLPKPGSWTCSTCYVNNSGDKLSCSACETKKPGSVTSTSISSNSTGTSTSVTSGFGAEFLPKLGSWTCTTCYVNNTADKMSCVACETKKPGSVTSTSISSNSTGTSTSVTSGFGAEFLPKLGSWTCTTCYVNNTADKMSCVACETKKPVSQTSTATTSAVNTTVTSSDIFAPKHYSALGQGFPSDFNSISLQGPSPFSFGNQTEAFSNTATSVANSPKSVFGGFTFSSNPVIQEPETSEVKDREILLVSTKAKNGPQVTKINTPKTSPFTGFSFKTSSFTTAAANTQSTVTSSPFSGFSWNSPQVSTAVTSVTSTSNVTSTTSSNISISSIQSSMQNVTPAFVFSKNPDNTTSTDVEKSSAPPSDPSKSDNEFVFGVKRSAQPTTFSFGLTGLSSKSNETVGFKPTFTTTTNAPAVFGGTTQTVDSSKLSSVFGGSAKTEPTQISSIFGGTAKKSDSAPVISSVFGGATQQSESTASVFGKSTTSETVLSKSIFGGSSEKSEVSSTLSSSEPVFNFGSADDSKGETIPLEFRFGSPQKYEFNFSGVRPRSPTKTPKSPATPSDVEEEEENESFDADNIYFQPVIPLPPKVDVKTGEENEITLFCKRAKLFRFCSGEWKERGIGDIKILHDETVNKIRLLMRRDQVLKVCLNHYLTSDITFEKRGDKTLSWAATDFSESEPCPELFALRFKTAEFADEFLAAIESARKISTNEDVKKAAAGFSFKIDNTPKTESLFTPGSLSSRFGTSVPSSNGNPPSTVEIKSCFGDVSFSLSDTAGTSAFFKGSSNLAANDQKSTFSFGAASSKEEPKATQSDDDEIQIVYEVMPSPEDQALAEKLQLPRSFFLYKNKPPCPGCIGCEDFTPPPKSNSSGDAVITPVSESTTSDIVPENTNSSKESENAMFNVSNSLSFADLASKTGFGGLSGSVQKKTFEGAGTPLFANLNCSAEGDGDDDTVAQGPDIHFEPVIPLPELITVTTGEEDETPIFVNRAKLFRYDASKKEWKERGVGDLKILKHNEKLRFRIILRRDQVHKIACNHCISENMELSPLATSETALCWNALDYSEGQPEASQFAVRFKNKDMLQQFKEKFNECKELLRKGDASTNVQNSAQSITTNESTKKETPPKEVVKTENDYESSESETNEDDEESDEDSTLFEKRVSFEISDGNDNEFKSVGMGLLKVIYDDNVYGYRVFMTSDSGDILCDHIIAIQTALRVEKKKATWAAIDLSLDPPRRRRFRATFSSVDAVKEFGTVFEDGKDVALNSEIVEKTDCYFTPPGQQT